MIAKADFERNELSVIVRKVIERYLRSRENKNGIRTLVVFTDWITGIEDTLDYCEEEFDPKHTDYLLEKTYPGVNKMGAIFKVGNDDDERLFVNQLSKYKRLVVMSPTIKALRSVASGVPEGISERAMLQLILNQAEVKFIMNFNPQNLPTGKFSTELRKLIEDIADMGVKFEFGLPDFEPAPVYPVLITAEMIEDAHKKGQRVIKADSKTIVTPLAKDMASDLNIRFME